MTQYNELLLIENDLPEEFKATVTNKGVYLDHNMKEGALWLSHEDFRKLNNFRKEFLDEINCLED